MSATPILTAKGKVMKFDVTNRFSDEVQFTAEIESENASVSEKLGLAIKWAIRTGAKLDGANLARANLARANLGNAVDRAGCLAFGWLCVFIN
jgi:uncharacterized protein YjbI with pentapeptide repeats